MHHPAKKINARRVGRPPADRGRGEPAPPLGADAGWCGGKRLPDPVLFGAEQVPVLPDVKGGDVASFSVAEWEAKPGRRAAGAGGPLAVGDPAGNG